jgi:hypothetical protein
MLERNNYLYPTDPDRANRILSELGDPEHAFNLNLEFSRGKFTIGYQMRFIDKMVLDTAENVFSVQGRAPENADYGPITYYPSVMYHDLRLGYDLTE